MVISSVELCEHAQTALDDFALQDWPHLEMVLINLTGREFRLPDRCREWKIKFRKLQEAKNAALYNAQGEWCVPWAEDCRYDAGYVGFHMLQRDREVPTTISNPLAHVLKDMARIAAPLDEEQAPFVCYFRLQPYVYGLDATELSYVKQFQSVRRLFMPSELAFRLFRHE